MSLTPEQFRAMLDESLAPIVDRLAAVEERANPDNPDPAAVEEPVVDPRIAKLEADLRAANLATEAAEQRVVALASSGSHRVGRSAIGLSVGNPFTASTVYDGMIERCKTAAPTLARACATGKKLLLGKNGDLERHATHAELSGFLRALCNTAEIDAVITPPSQRVAWS